MFLSDHSGLHVLKNIQTYKTPLAVLIFLLGFIAVAFGPPNYNSESGFGAFIDKHNRLDEQASPKVVLVGGSNVALGIDSAELQQLLKRPVVNMGFGCTVGLRYMLEEIKEAIKPGDLIVVMPEYDFFCSTTTAESNAQVNGSCELLNLVQAYPPSFKWVFNNYVGSPERFISLLDDSHKLMLSKVDFYRRGIVKLSDVKSGNTLATAFAVTPNMYNDRHAYNSYGDMTAHLNKVPPGLHGMEVINYQKYKFNSEGAGLLEKFGELANKKGATVVILPPPLPDRVYSKWHDRADDIYSHWQQISHTETLASPTTFVFPEKYFYDTAYHLTAIGRDERTRKIANELKVHSLCSVRTPLPQ